MYVVKKPIDIGGKRRIIGEVLQDKEVVSPTLIRSGYVAKIDSGVLDSVEGVVEPLKAFPEGTVINVPITTKDGTLVIPATCETVCNAFRLLQTGADEAIKEIEVSEDEDLLIILDACDSRKAVHTAVRNRAGDLKAVEKSEAEREGTE